MPVYEYRCRTCDEPFERRRPMSDANAPTDCPRGHPDTVRMLSVFARAGTASGPGGPPAGGCCGGACGCAG